MLSGAMLSACVRQSPPDLLDVTDLNPKTLEVGDRVTLAGSGFPEGRAARVTFRGDVFRAGHPPERDVILSAPATAADPRSVTVVFSNELSRQFCGGADGIHATFRGAVQASFQARASAAPPVSGSLEGVVLDVNPPIVSDTSLAQQAEEAGRFAAFVGVTLVRSPQRDVFVIDTVDPEGNAARAGLLPGTAVLELDGVRIRNLSDLVPPPHARLSHWVVSDKDDLTPRTFAIDSAGFESGSPSELGPAATIVGLAVLLLALIASPFGRVIGWLERSLAERIRSFAASERRRSLVLPTAARDFLRALGRELPGSPLPYLVFILDTGVLALLALNRPIVMRELDIPVLFLGSLTALCLAALVLGGARDGRRFSLFAGLRCVARVGIFQLPVVAALLCAVVLTGSLRSDDILTAQGGLPWQWLVFSNPLTLGVMGLLLLGLTPVIRRGDVGLERNAALMTHSAARGVSLPEWSHLVITSGVIALVFLGGPRVPGVPLYEHGGSLALQVGGAFLFQLKTIVVALSILSLRLMTSHVALSDVAGLGLRYLAPLSVLVVMGSCLLALGSRGPWFASLRGPMSYALCAATVLLGFHSVARVSTELASGPVRPSVNPWL
jgi:NADH-quinone oxidoreductase subunit H